MEIIEVKGHTYRLAKNLNEWRRLVKKDSADYLPFGVDIKDYSPHHIFAQRGGMLGRIVENGVMVPHEIHALQKSTDLMARHRLDSYVSVVIGDAKWVQLSELSRYFKYVDPGGYRVHREQK